MSEKLCTCEIVEETKQEILAICAKYKESKGALISILNEVQELLGYIPIQVQEIIARETGISISEIYGVVTFYSRFTLEPVGKYKVSVCLGTACYVKGAEMLLNSIKKHINIDVGETTPDNQFTLEGTRCIGACGLAPVITIGDDVYGNLKSEQVAGILAKYMEEEG